jgi:hypothetical protein
MEGFVVAACQQNHSQVMSCEEQTSGDKEEFRSSSKEISGASLEPSICSSKKDILL